MQFGPVPGVYGPGPMGMPPMMPPQMMYGMGGPASEFSSYFPPTAQALVQQLVQSDKTRVITVTFFFTIRVIACDN